MEFENERWLPCPNFETKYLISDYGRIKSLGTYNTCKKGGLRKLTPKKSGYVETFLYDDGRKERVSVHVLVAKAFVSNPLNFPMVNHKDENPSNNYYKNLEWCDNRYNTRYSKAKAIDVYTINGDFVETCEAVTDVANKYGVPTRNISRCCKVHYNTRTGYTFRYHGEKF